MSVSTLVERAKRVRVDTRLAKLSSENAEGSEGVTARSACPTPPTLASRATRPRPGQEGVELRRQQTHTRRVMGHEGSRNNEKPQEGMAGGEEKAELLREERESASRKAIEVQSKRSQTSRSRETVCRLKLAKLVRLDYREDAESQLILFTTTRQQSA